MKTVRAAVLAILASLGFALPAAAGRDCEVSRLEGDSLSIWQAGTWSELGPGPLPAAAAKLRTGTSARAEIRCDDGLVVTVGVATEVNLEVLVVPGDAGVLLQLVRGILGLAAPDPVAGGVEVRTPLAIAAVRSTEWLVEHGDAEGSAVFVRAGRVGVRAGTAAVTLGPGEGVTVEPSGAVQPVKRWGAPRIARSTGALGFDWR